MVVMVSVGRGFLRAWRRAAAPRLSSSLQFAQALMARHGHGVHRSTQLALLLAVRARSPQLTVHRRSAQSTTQLSLTLQTVLQRGQRLHAQPGRRKTELPPAGARLDSVLRLPQSELTSAHAPIQAPVSGRILARRARVDVVANSQGQVVQAKSLARGPDAFRATVPPERMPADLPMVRQRSNTAALNVRGGPPVEPAPAVPNVSRTASSTSTQALPPHEIDRITEQVMGSIDRRILAERERHGRV